MHLLDALEQRPDVTQRDLSVQIGAALGLTNLMLRRLAKKGYIKITGTKRSRIRYLITPKGLLEKTRLTYEFIQHSLTLYSGVRRFLRQRLSALAKSGSRTVLLCGTDEMAEIALLTVRELGLEIAGVTELSPSSAWFFGYPVLSLDAIHSLAYDQIVVSALPGQEAVVRRLQEAGVPPERIISFPRPAVVQVAPICEAASARAASDSPGLSAPAPEATDVIILCGGRGTRLGTLTTATPKPLLPVGESPFLLHLLRRLQQEGFSRFILATQYLSEQFQAFIADAAAAIPNLELVVEPEPLGTGGALRYAAERVRSGTFVALNGDTWVTQPILPVLQQHSREAREGTLVAVRASHVEGRALNKGVWDVGPQGEVRGFRTQAEVPDGWVNAGLYVLSRELVLSWPMGAYSLEANLQTLLSHRRARVFCSEARLLDIGTPECYAEAARTLGAQAEPLAHVESR